MSISIDTNGRVVTGRTNVVIPPENAGVGDLVYCKASADPKVASNLKVIGWGTVSNANNITIDSVTYVLYSVIFGFCNGMAYVVAKEEVTRRWSMLASDTGSEASSGSTSLNSGYQLVGSTISTNNNIIRNGAKGTYAGMNLNSLMQNSYTGANTILHPTAAWGPSVVMSKANFDALALGGGNAKDLYGTWENYVRQTMCIVNPGSCFAATDGDRKPHEQGKWNTYLLGQYTKTSPDTNANNTGDCWYPAANYCYNYAVSGTGESASSHNWWLPSMFELRMLMADEHWSKVNTCGATTLNNRLDRWSSIRCFAAEAWDYAALGWSDYDGTRYAYTARPVTLLKLI